MNNEVNLVQRLSFLHLFLSFLILFMFKGCISEKNVLYLYYTIALITNQNNHKMNSKVFKLAHKIKAQFSTWSEALKFAWGKVKFQFKLRSSNVSFSFIKKNGEERPANGTLNLEYKSKSTSKPSVWYIVKYFDLDKDSWRSFDFRNLIK